MRYFAKIAYNGSHFCGWQRQPNGVAVQQVVEEALSLILRESIEVVGCGRTDTGVHARQFFLHFDYERPLDPSLLYKLNRIIHPGIAFYSIFPVEQHADARFDAFYREYQYHITWKKNPFLQGLVTHLPRAHRLELALLNEAARTLLDYEDFFPFCKTGSDARHTLCTLSKAEWTVCETDDQLVFYIGANRFLRGMVRLIVGMCINVARGRITVEELRLALETKTRLKLAESAPPDGLYLTKIFYPDHLLRQGYLDQDEAHN